MIAKPNIFAHKSQEEDIKSFREWSWIFEKYLSAVDEGYIKDLKQIHDNPNDKLDMDLAEDAEKTRCIIVSFIGERKGAAIGESCGRFQWV